MNKIEAQEKFDKLMSEGIHGYRIALDLAECHLPEKAQEAAKACFDSFKEGKVNYGIRILDIAKKYFPAKLNKLAWTLLEECLASYEAKLKFDATHAYPSEQTKFEFLGDLLKDRMLSDIKHIEQTYFDKNGMIYFENGDGMECRSVDVDKRIADIEARVLDVSNSPFARKLKQSLKEAIERKDRKTAKEIYEHIGILF